MIPFSRPVVIFVSLALLIWLAARPGERPSPQVAAVTRPQSSPAGNPADGSPSSADGVTPPLDSGGGGPSERRPTRDPNQSILGRIICDHFRSHPPTEERIRFLRDLGSGRGRDGGLGNDRLPEDPVDLFIDLKKRLVRGFSEGFSEAVGPLSIEDEWALGVEVRKDLLKTMEIDASAGDRLTRLAEPLLRQRKRTKGMPFTFTVVNKDEVNAFAHLGGHVYVYTGLLKLLTQDAPLQFVLGHEIGHIELEHCAKAALPGITAQRIAGGFAKLPADIAQNLLRLSYSKDDEHDADSWAFRRMRDCGASQADALAFFQILLQYEKNRDRSQTEAGSQSAAATDSVQ
jgi:Zn-dependent protease with chaperone function